MTTDNSFPLDKKQILDDYNTAFISRQASLLGRKEVLSGKAKFGIFGDGKEVAQVAMARAFQKGDWRAGYYRDQTFMLAIGELTVQQFFAQLYADTNIAHDPSSGGRQMNSHFASRYYKNGKWTDQANQYNIAADLSPTAGQMAKLVGLGYASKLYRNSAQLKAFKPATNFSNNGNEVAFGTIGNASTSEGHFWESMNAAGVLQIPLAMSVWDDGYGISVPAKFQTTKSSISKIMAGFQNDQNDVGFEIYEVSGWDYEALVKTYLNGVKKCRLEHNPCLFHIVDLTQPQGHSTSGSHERYKSDERLSWERDFDCLTRMKHWLIEQKIAKEDEIANIERIATEHVLKEKEAAWRKVQAPMIELKKESEKVLQNFLASIPKDAPEKTHIERVIKDLSKSQSNQVRITHASVRKAKFLGRFYDGEAWESLRDLDKKLRKLGQTHYNTHLYVNSSARANELEGVPAQFSDASPKVDGRQIIQSFFDKALAKDPRIFIIGEDVGKLGGVNLEFEGLSDKYGSDRVTDTGIREATILGQGQGAAMRGLRPIVDIQYLDYLLYCLQGLSDDVATLHYRSCGGQINPVIVRTKGHRLEGIWHTGSPIGMILNSIKGIHFCVPRNMLQAAGFYNTLLKGDDPALVIEVLNGYRVKEKLPDNLSEFALPLGQVETLSKGDDVTVVTYGACCKVAEEAVQQLLLLNVSVELIDIQTLSPFDMAHDIRKSLEKTNALIVMDEDVPGGASAFILKRILEDQNAYDFLDAMPRTLCAAENRGAYASDADYYCKPSAEDLVELTLDLMAERYPGRY